MKIVVVEFSPSGGLYQFALQMAQAYAAEGHEVRLLTGKRPELRPNVPGVELRDILPTWHPAAVQAEPIWIRKPRRLLRAARLVLAWLMVRRELLRSRPDVVQWAEWRFSLDAWFVARLARRGTAVHVDVAHTPKPFAEQRTSGDLYKSSAPLLRALDAGYREMDLVLVLGESARRELQATFPSVDRVQIIPHGDESIFAAGDVRPRPAGNQPPRILLFGTLARYKGLDLLLDAFETVRRRVPEAQLHVVGAAVDIDIDAVRSRATGIGGVELRVGYVPASEVAGLVSSARVLAAPYVIANQSGVVHLAHTFGRPVVATDVGDLSVAVVNETTGLLVPPDDPGALADALVRLLVEPELATRLGAAAYEHSLESASWATVVRQVLPVFEELVAARSAKHDTPARVAVAS